MKNNNSRTIVITTLFVFLMVFVVPLILLITMDSISYFDQPPLDLIYELYGDRVIKQEFTPSNDFLNGIGMSIKNPNLVNKKQIKMEIYQNDNLVRTSALSGFNISDGAFVKFNFPAIENSANRKLEIILLSPKSSEKEPLGIFLTKGKNRIGSLTFGKKVIDGGIALVGYYQINSKLGLIRYVFGNFVLRFLSDSLFAISYLMMILGSVCILINTKSSKK